MELYTFIPNNYESAFFVVADSPEVALANVISYLKKEAEKEKQTHPEGYHFVPYYLEWKGASVDNLPDGYSIQTKEIGEVISWSTG